LHECLQKVKWIKVEAQLMEHVDALEVASVKHLNKEERRRMALKFCLSQAFFMNVCKCVPATSGAKAQQSFLSFDPDGILMKLDRSSALNDCLYLPQWIVYTSASAPATGGEGMGLIK